MHISDYGTKQLKPLFEKHISKEAKIRTDKWRGYAPLKNDYKEFKQEISNRNQNFKLFDHLIMMIKGWLRGIHHSEKNLQPYLDEFCYRFNWSNSIKRILHNITTGMKYHQPIFINQFKWGR